jgi:hypothetical protein
VEEAFAAFAGLVNEGVDAGEISSDAHAELLDDARQVLEAYQVGDLEKAVEQLDELRSTIDGYLEEGEITTADRGQALHDAVDDVERAITSSIPGDEGQGNEGRGKGKGKGKGHDEGDD